MKNWKNRLVYAMVGVYLLLQRQMVYATGFKGSIYETGTKKMLKDLLGTGQAILAALVLLMVVIWELMKRAGDENEEGRYSKRQKNAVIGLIIAETVSTLFGIIGGYYGVTIG